jgi:diphosphomevalonate decarboxylase
MEADTLAGKYLAEGNQRKPDNLNGEVEWECASNIALVKYWGKKPEQIPANPSLSFTLSESRTRMIADFSVSKDAAFKLEYRYEGKPNALFEQRLLKYFEQIRPYLPFIEHMHIKIDSSATFPHSAGIASSASSFGALALDLCSIEQKTKGGTAVHDYEFFRKASFLARLGSGSASRSLFGGVVLWGLTSAYPGSDNEAAIPVTGVIKPVYKDFRDSILIVSTTPKAISSSEGHALMSKHPYSEGRYLQANNNLKRLFTVLHNGDLAGFTDIIENEAFSLHAMIMSSFPGYFLLKPNTLEIIDKIQHYRLQTDLPLSFTLDAGANVHLLYPVFCEQHVRTFIQDELLSYCENNQVIHDHVGQGPLKLR